MPELVFFRRGEEVLRVGLERQRLMLGRGQDSDVVIPDPHVSRQHVALLHDGTRCLRVCRRVVSPNGGPCNPGGRHVSWEEHPPQRSRVAHALSHFLPSYPSSRPVHGGSGGERARRAQRGRR
jgi:hypothetical protein